MNLGRNTIGGELLRGFAPDLMRKFCENLKRQLVVGPKLKSDMRKGAVIERLITSVHPHPDQGKPRLWSFGAKDEAVRAMPWPLPKADEIGAEAEPLPQAAGDKVVRPTFGRTEP